DGDALGIIGFCGAPFTLASYMIEGGSSRNYIETKRMMYSSDSVWPLLMEKLVEVLVAYAAQQVEAGADVIQIFDSWVGALSVTSTQSPSSRRMTFCAPAYARSSIRPPAAPGIYSILAMASSPARR